MTATQALQKAIEDNTRAIAHLSQELALHNLKQEVFENLVTKHETALYGTSQHKGLLQKFDVVEDKVLSTFNGFSKAIWIMVGVFLSAFAVFLWQTFFAGLILVKP